MGCTLASHGQYHWTVYVRSRCSLASNYFDHLLPVTTTTTTTNTATATANTTIFTFYSSAFSFSCSRLRQVCQRKTSLGNWCRFFYGPDALLVMQTTVSAKTNVTHATLSCKHGTTIRLLFTDRRYTSTFQQASQLPFIVTTLSEAGFESASSFFGSICSQQCIISSPISKQVKYFKGTNEQQSEPVCCGQVTPT